MDLRTIKKLLELIVTSDVEEIEVQQGEELIRIKRRSNENTINTPLPPNVQISPNPIEIEKQVAKEKITKDKNLVEVTAPFVGTFYKSPNPDSAPFIIEGQKIKKGETLCILEAMKTMNEIIAPCSGTIQKIHIEDSMAVGYGDCLITIQKT